MEQGAIDWNEISDLICKILTTIQQNRTSIEKQAASRGISLEQLTAAAIVQAIREQQEL